MTAEHARKAGLASGRKRQTPELIAKKATCVEWHTQRKWGLNAIAARIGHPTASVRKWLIAAGVYCPRQRDTSPVEPLKRSKRYSLSQAIKRMAAEFASESRKAESSDMIWGRHKAIACHFATLKYWANWREPIGQGKRPSTRHLTREQMEQRLKEQKREYRRRYSKEPRCKIMHGLRRRIRDIAKRKVGIRSSILVGCNSDQLRAHIESQWRPGMHWGNYGQWHIDHIIPLAAFDLTKDKDKRTASHFSNLQPLWHWENTAKGDKMLRQASLL